MEPLKGGWECSGASEATIVPLSMFELPTNLHTFGILGSHLWRPENRRLHDLEGVGWGVVGGGMTKAVSISLLGLEQLQRPTLESALVNSWYEWSHRTARRILSNGGWS